MVSYQRAKEGIYELIEMNRRYNATPLPEVELVDMREELRAGNNGIFSSRLYQEMQRSLSAGKQIILFLNRRGYATFISCRSCGEAMKCPECGISLVYHKRAMKCPECGISLVYHKRKNALICHYCGKKFPVPRVCPACGSREIRFAGRGTEQIEELVKQAFPDHLSARLDLDTAKNTREIRKLMTSFAKGRTEILIGTQLVAKGQGTGLSERGTGGGTGGGCQPEYPGLPVCRTPRWPDGPEEGKSRAGSLSSPTRRTTSHCVRRPGMIMRRFSGKKY